MTNFSTFLASAKEVSYGQFITSRIALESGINDSWWPSVKPKSFTVIGECWLAEFEWGYWTLIESQEYTGSLEALALLVWNWLQEEA